ncbi:uncharacterized protein A1O9_07248 [Exophiala aquamarina CBS 119918]|uniref:NmrA-like domain-containing protein n=1 Tax=Exophiala aquamarina CBS 119918 TaxID=1182545 RepID=A0A072PCN3_9EURO|nr:uncharacterized protein A1O9_07248 [Exophiala aquamarina CBS 119918]KEF57058.1 hypothetical protein A1O9_07248 [Exophiala aquamarina CBS 119918]
MLKQKVFLVGATGETGGSILQALDEDGSFEITCFIRTASAGKPSVQHLKDKGLKVVHGDLTDPPEKLAGLLKDIDTVILTIFAFDVGIEANIIQAASMAAVKRFVLCDFGTPCPRGIMPLRDRKEAVHDLMFAQKLGFTIIDVGYWYEISFPRVPSGKFDYAAVIARNQVVEGGTAPNMLIAKKDIGGITVEIIKDERTLNKKVFVCGDVLNQNEITAIIEEKTGEKLDLTTESAEYVRRALAETKKAAEGDPTNLPNKYRLSNASYNFSKYIRGDNTPENAEYPGYIDGRKLYPNFVFQKFSEFVDDLAAGKVARVYPHLTL